MNPTIQKPLFTFGILADVQYADVEDLFKYGRKRYYTTVLQNLTQALQNWKNESDFKFILQLGDLIDSRKSYTKSADECLEDVLNIFKTENYDLINVLNIWGNHELTAFKRDQLTTSILNTAKSLNQNSGSNYYFYNLNDRLRIICLDEYEFSVFGFDKTNSIYKSANNFVYKKSLINSQDATEIQYNKRFLRFNGAISELQFQWLKNQLDFCNINNKKVILSGHIPLLPETSDGCAVWNSDKIMELLWSYDNLVLTYLAGHYHAGGYYKDKKNIHHLTLNGMLETSLDSDNSFVTVYVYENKIDFKNQIKDRSFTVFY